MACLRRYNGVGTGARGAGGFSERRQSPAPPPLLSDHVGAGGARARSPDMACLRLFFFKQKTAYEIASATNTFPEICGRICPQDRLCEGNCVIEQSGHGTVTIGAVERYLTDKAWEMGWVRPLAAGEPRGQSVGIVGAGPAGLAAAERLRELGYAVTVYERHDRAGGLLVYG